MKTILILLFLGINLYSQTPQTLNYQGYLTDAGGNSVSDGNQNITFRIYDVSTGGAALWTEARTVTTTDGVFSVVLGENTPIDLAFDTQYYLGITVGATELSPRTKLASSAYASNLPKVCFIKDVKANGTNGGTFSSGAWRTRDLNTLEGNTDFISLNANQFTLDAGTYVIEATSQAFRVDRHKLRIQNITDGVTEFYGLVARSPDINSTVGYAVAIGQVSIISQKVFELQHKSNVTQNSQGFGLATSLGGDEVFSIIKITKITN